MKRRYDILLDTTMRCKGVNATTCYGSQMFKLFLQDQDFLEEFLDKRWGKPTFFVWWLFAQIRDEGRSGEFSRFNLLFAREIGYKQPPVWFHKQDKNNIS